VGTPNGCEALVAAALANADVYSAAGAFGAAQLSSVNVEALSTILFTNRRDALRLARWEHTPAILLQAIGDHASNDHMMQARLMKNQNSPMAGEIVEQPEVLDRSLLGLVAQHPQAPKALLMKLATEDQDVMLLKAIARNPASDAEVLDILVKRAPTKLASEIVANPAASSEMLEMLYQQEDVYIKSAVLGHERFVANSDFMSQVQVDAGLIPGKVALKSKQDQLLLQRQLAKFALPIMLLKTLAQSEDSAVRAAVANNPAFVDVHFLIADQASVVRRALAARADLSINQMQSLSMDKDVWVRVWLARNASIDRNTMLHLAQDEEQEVRRGVARNKRCPLALLEKFAVDDFAWVRAAVAYQANANADLLLQLASDQDVDVLSGVAANSHTPKTIMHQLGEHADADVRRGVILNKAADRETLLPMLQDAYYLHRMLLVWNQQLTADDKWSLYDDPDENVRFVVFKWFGDMFLKTEH
jgi:hypothetical protein